MSDQSPTHPEQILHEWQAEQLAKLPVDQQTFPLPATNRKLSKQESKSKPLAAFRLGHLSFTFRMWQQLCVDFPDGEDVISGPLFAIGQMRAALTVVAESIKVGVWTQFHDSLAKARATMRAWLKYGDPSKTVEASIQANWLHVQTLAGRLFYSAPALQRWFNLGAALGAFELTCHESGDLEPFPNVRPIVNAAKKLPNSALVRIPSLQRIVQLARRKDGFDILMEGIGLPQEWKSILTPADDRGLCTSQLIIKLNDQLEEAIPSIFIREKHATQPRPALRIEWKRDEHCLYVDGKRVRRVRPNAKDLIAVLDAFENQRWRRPIIAPLSDGEKQLEELNQRPESTRLHGTLKSMNSRIKKRTITFHADGTGTGITYRLHGEKAAS